ncbi:hypothetical protein XW81_01500 [Buchnera aphidicola (Schlechtendalia chinensis)]|uniref:Uncharacterized protein n=1 Tax=Buchnera aphidicola subsp. Schlechtendalia chinensis TaxID=118110 RepID=A0A172WDR5_BUCSC|nr:hypothetical protein XW81_01500 [Buchnera aphidicola (Schlechtendalia chinensis)]
MNIYKIKTMYNVYNYLKKFVVFLNFKKKYLLYNSITTVIIAIFISFLKNFLHNEQTKMAKNYLIL